MLGMTIAELDDRMPFLEYLSWQRYFRIYRFPDELADLSFATLSSIVANIMRPKGYAAWRPEQFRLIRRDGFEEQDDTPKNEARSLFGR